MNTELRIFRGKIYNPCIRKGFEINPAGGVTFTGKDKYLVSWRYWNKLDWTYREYEFNDLETAQKFYARNIERMINERK
jgi:hypothetical protein